MSIVIRFMLFSFELFEFALHSLVFINPVLFYPGCDPFCLLHPQRPVSLRVSSDQHIIRLQLLVNPYVLSA